MSSIRLPSVLDDWTFTRGHLSCDPWNEVMDDYSRDIFIPPRETHPLRRIFRRRRFLFRNILLIHPMLFDFNNRFV